MKFTKDEISNIIKQGEKAEGLTERYYLEAISKTLFNMMVLLEEGK